MVSRVPVAAGASLSSSRESDAPLGHSVVRHDWSNPIPGQLEPVKAECRFESASALKTRCGGAGRVTVWRMVRFFTPPSV